MYASQKKVVLILKTKDLAKGDPENKGLTVKAQSCMPRKKKVVLILKTKDLRKLILKIKDLASLLLLKPSRPFGQLYFKKMQDLENKGSNFKIFGINLVGADD